MHGIRFFAFFPFLFVFFLFWFSFSSLESFVDGTYTQKNYVGYKVIRLFMVYISLRFPTQAIRMQYFLQLQSIPIVKFEGGDLTQSLHYQKTYTAYIQLLGSPSLLKSIQLGEQCSGNQFKTVTSHKNQWYGTSNGFTNAKCYVALKCFYLLDSNFMTITEEVMGFSTIFHVVFRLLVVKFL